MNVVISLIIAALIAILVCSSFSKQLHTAEEKTEANAYLEPGSLRLTQQEDRFINTTRQVIKTEDKDGNGQQPGGFPAGPGRGPNFGPGGGFGPGGHGPGHHHH